MKIVVTGSLGNISKPLTEELIKKGYQVTVVSSKIDKQAEIEQLGAVAAIGSIENTDFVMDTFKGADLIYTMIPPQNYFDHNLDLVGVYEKIGTNYAQAIKKNSIKKLINLSSIGGHLNEGNGILLGAHRVENILNALPCDVGITHMRPTEFYYNLLPQVHSAKANGFIGSNIGNEVVNSWVSPKDIAAAIVDEIEIGVTGRNVRYVACEEVTYDELAKVLGEAIGKKDLKWIQFTDEQIIDGLKQAGMHPEIAEGLAEMYHSINTGLLYEDYKLNKPANFGKVKLKHFAKDFAAAFNA